VLTCVVGYMAMLCVNRRYFIDENSMKDHFKTKLHKKRYVDSLSHNNHH